MVKCEVNAAHVDPFGAERVRPNAWPLAAAVCTTAPFLWCNERYQDALNEAEECLRKARNFRGADNYRAVALVGLGRLDEAKAQLEQCMARPGGIVTCLVGSWAKLRCLGPA